MSDRILPEKGLVVRHGIVEIGEHWAIAISGLILLVTGLFELPLANRYYITSLPGLGWSGDFIKALYIHYAASVVFIAASVFHLLYHGIRGERGMLPQWEDIRASILVIGSFFGKGEEPPFHKYLPEQRLAYVGMAVIIAMLILSGLVKTYKNLYAPDMPLALTIWATWIHNVFFVLFILALAAHIGALALKPNRPMFRGIFTGTVRLDYARRRHPLWIAELEGKDEGEARLEGPPGVEEGKGLPAETPEGGEAEGAGQTTAMEPAAAYDRGGAEKSGSQTADPHGGSGETQRR
ncbi:MAG: cytochrome b/b6 domain-containing protein [Pseudomonadota bacterium]|nr:cytochrome b/b6 domain-containing protein [Pseudomonadota bacterium]